MTNATPNSRDPIVRTLPALTLRPDLRAVAELVAPGTKVLDLGCGDGDLLDFLKQERQVKGRGIELTEAGVLACVRRGLSVRQGNLQEGLADYPDESFDSVILSQTLPFLSGPELVLKEMLRVGKQAIVSLPNWGYWRCRLELLLQGRMPQPPGIPQPWHSIPRWQAFTVTDFVLYCDEIKIEIDRQIYLTPDGKQVDPGRFKNLLAAIAVFTLRKR